MSLGPKVIVTPFGGHGTVSFVKYFHSLGQPTMPRIDYFFSEELKSYDLDSKPQRDQMIVHQGTVDKSKGRMRTKRLLNVHTEWYFRTGLKLNYDATIRDNLNAALHAAAHKVILFGKCSLTEPFLTNNEIEALCIIRHPLYAYDSFLVRRHPQWGEKAGGVNTIQCAEWYAEKWKAVVDDFASSGNPIVYYETLIENLNELGYTKLADILKPIWKPRREELSVTKIDVINYLNKLDSYHRRER